MSQGLDIVIPVYNEGDNIIPVLASFEVGIKTRPLRVLICYDFEEDTTLAAIGEHAGRFSFEVVPVKNTVARGPHGAVRAGFAASQAPCVLVFPADDVDNAPMVDQMVKHMQEGSDIVCASRFMPGGCMVGCPWVKATLVRTAAMLLRYLAFLPTRDPTNGLRLFSRRVLTQVPIESTMGFTFSLELLVKVHRLRWKITEVPAKWFERRTGESRFQVGKWFLPYTRWLMYGFATTYLFRRPGAVKLNPSAAS